MGFGLRRRFETAATQARPLRWMAIGAHAVREAMVPRACRHPFDRDYGISTNAPLPIHLSRTGTTADDHLIPYAGCVPSALRQAIGQLPAAGLRSFVDIGCGKGRALVIASEFGFRRIVGVELNPDIAAIARRNARRIGRRFRGRTPIEVQVEDASAPELPPGDLLVFLYHPFGRPLVERLVDRLAVAARDRSIVAMYENPVHGDVLDAHPTFERCYAATLPCEEREAAFAFDREEAIVSWRSVAAGASKEASGGPRIGVTKAGYRAVLS